MSSSTSMALPTFTILFKGISGLANYHVFPMFHLHTLSSLARRRERHSWSTRFLGKRQYKAGWHRRWWGRRPRWRRWCPNSIGEEERSWWKAETCSGSNYQRTRGRFTASEPSHSELFCFLPDGLWFWSSKSFYPTAAVYAQFGSSFRRGRLYLTHIQYERSSRQQTDSSGNPKQS